MIGIKRRSVMAAALASALLLTLLLGGCGRRPAAAEPAESVSLPGNAEPTAQAAAEEQSLPETAPETAPETGTGRQDGERFEDVILLEGMEQTVRYEHVRNDALGFELDYDYELFERRGESDRACFVSRYDLPEDPQNYLEVTYLPLDADAVAAAVSEALSVDYDIIRESRTLERAGDCLVVDASNAKGDGGTPDLLQAVYIIPAADGCRVASAHYTFESAEGFGRRFSYFMNTFSVLAAQGDKRLSAERALAAVRRCCRIADPGLAGIEEAGEYPVYWEVSSSGEELVVLFRSYTGAQLRYHIDPLSGDAYVTEFVPGLSSEEARTGETLNLWAYAF